MKPGSIMAGRILLALLIVAALFTLVSWDRKQSTKQFGQYQQITDTVPKEKKTEREKKIRDLDDVIDEMNAEDWKLDIEKAMKEVEKAMKEIDNQKISLQIEKAMKEVDFEKMQKELKESMASMNIDMEKMNKELKESMKEFDSEKVKLEIEKAMKEVDMAKIQDQVKEAMSKVDFSKMQKELNEEMKKVNSKEFKEQMDNLKIQMEKLGPELKEQMEKAKVEIEKAKVEMKEYKSFVDGLEKDGLIKKSEGYTIKHKDGELIINGKKASNETYLKYRSFLEKHPKFNIDKNDDFNINVD